MKKSTVYMIIGAVLLGLVIGVVTRDREDIAVKKSASGCARQESKKTVLRADIREKAKASKVSSLEGEVDIRNAVVNVADEVGKAVVAISTERTQRVGYPYSDDSRFGRSPFVENEPMEKFFEHFFGQYPEREFKQRGLGSGVIIDKEGHVLTNFHVIEGADKISVALPDGRSFPGTIKGSDPRSDLAVIQIEAKDLPVAELGDSNLLQTGEWVIALGNPFAHILKSPKPTVTVGVISALHRQIPTPGADRGYLDMIQTDAAINPGNSGGPLCELNGKVIGINVAIFSTSGGYQGVGFAIPINAVKDILGDLIKGKEIEYGWLGVVVQEIAPDIAEYFGLANQKGALVSEVMPESPAKKGGLTSGDIVMKYNGAPINTVHDLLKAVSGTKIGDSARIEVMRDRVKKEIKVTIEKRPPRTEMSIEEKSQAQGVSQKWRGMRVTGIDEGIAAELGLKDKEGVAVVSIDPGSPSYNAGLSRGNIIREINRMRIRKAEDYKKVTQEAKGPALLRIDRIGYITVLEDEQ